MTPESELRHPSETVPSEPLVRGGAPAGEGDADSSTTFPLQHGRRGLPLIRYAATTFAKPLAMWMQRLVLILINALFVVGLFASVPGPMWARILIGGIILTLDIGAIIFETRRPRRPGQHPHSANR